MLLQTQPKGSLFFPPFSSSFILCMLWIIFYTLCLSLGWHLFSLRNTSIYRSPSKMHCRGGLWELNSLYFILSENCLIPPSNLSDNLARFSILGSRPFCFIVLHTSCHSLLACRVSVEKSDDSLFLYLLFLPPLFIC